MSTPAIISFYTRNRYGFLFYTLLLSLILLPLSRPLGISHTVVLFLLAANLLAGITALGAVPARHVTTILLLLALASKPVAALLHFDKVAILSQGVWAAFGMLMAAASVRFALRGKTVGSEQVYAALSAYLFAGLFFGQTYWVIDQFLPGSISEAGMDANPISSTAAFYFSFVTLTSLGYGDIVPTSDLTRGIAVVEVVSGQLYLAVLVARLIGIVRNESK